MNRGYIKLYRKALDSRLAQNMTLFGFWCFLLLKANHKAGWVSMKTGRGTREVYLKPGQFVLGRKGIAKDTRLKPSTVRNFLERLKNLQKLDIEPDTHWSLITIKNWDSYQLNENFEDTQKDRQRTPKGHPKDTNKNDKNDKNEEEKEISDKISSLRSRYPEQKIINRVFKEIASTRKTNKVADSVLLKQLERWEKYPVEEVLVGIKIYLEKDCASEGKDEMYLMGIIRKNSSEKNNPSKSYKPTGVVL